MTKGAAEDALHDVIRGARPPEEGATFGELTKWYLKTNEGRWSKKWNVTVNGFFTHHILPELGSKVAAKIMRSEIQQTINRIAASPNCQSGSMVRKCLTQIGAVFTSAIIDKVLDVSPMIKIDMPPTRRASERFLSLEECQRLLHVASRREYLIIRLFVVLGFRPGELFALRVNDLQPGRLRIDQTVVEYRLQDGAKTEGSVGDVPLPPEFESELRAYILEEKIEDLLFPSEAGTPISPENYLDRGLKKLGVLAGIDVKSRLVTITRGKKKGQTREVLTSALNHQVLRRTTATHFQKHGQIKDTQALLRHSEPETTLKHYQKKLEDSLVRGVEGWDAELVPKRRREGDGAIPKQQKVRVN
ncbi:MAG TPA: tyrosine-type recombinase/integrase [Edaphobacter sp.]|nr:tyrosine-type recombinase/integrase [Edaphobacter sp.]